MTPEREESIKKHLGNKWFKLVKELDDNPKDYSNFAALAKDCWLFLTTDKMPARANIKKEAFLHEVAAMITTAVIFNQPKKVYAIYSGCKYEGGGVDKIFIHKAAAIECANELYLQKQKETERNYGKDSEDYEESLYNDFSWKQDNETSWSNSIDVISIIEYELSQRVPDNE